MNGLILPKHWRFNWPMLMGHLQLTSGHLSRTSTGHLAKCNPCFCTDVPVSVTFSGATGCLAIMNGTFSLTSSVSVDCSFAYYQDNRPAPPDPCLDANACYYDFGVSDWLWWLITISAGVSFNKVDDTCVAAITTQWDPYVQSSEGICTLSSRIHRNIIESVTFDRSGCTTGTMVIDSSIHQDPYLGSLPTSCTVAF